MQVSELFRVLQNQPQKRRDAAADCGEKQAGDQTNEEPLPVERLMNTALLS